MKKSFSIFIVIVLIIGVFAALTTGVSARGRHQNRCGGRGYSSRNSNHRRQYAERDRHEDCMNAYKEYVDGLQDKGDLTKKEASDYRQDSERRAIYHVDGCPRFDADIDYKENVDCRGNRESAEGTRFGHHRSR